MSNIGKSQLSTYLQVTCGLDKKKANEVVEATLELVQKQIRKGNKVTLQGIGTLSTRLTAPRTVSGFGKNFSVKEKVKLRFKASRLLSNLLNKQDKITQLTDLRTALRSEDDAN